MVCEYAIPNIASHLDGLDGGLDVLDYSREALIRYPVEFLVVCSIYLLVRLQPQAQSARIATTRQDQEHWRTGGGAKVRQGVAVRIDSVLTPGHTVNPPELSPTGPRYVTIWHSNVCEST